MTGRSMCCASRRYLLALVWLPPAEAAARAEVWLYEGRARDGAEWRAALAGFIDRTDRMLALIEGFMPESSWLDDPETLTYLHPASRPAGSASAFP